MACSRTADAEQRYGLFHLDAPAAGAFGLYLLSGGPHKQLEIVSTCLTLILIDGHCVSHLQFALDRCGRVRIRTHFIPTTSIV